MNTNTVEERIARGTANDTEFRAWMIDHGCPASLIESVQRKNAAAAPQIAARKAALEVERRNAGRQKSAPQVRARSKNGVAYRWAQIEDGLISEDSEADIARRRRLMQAIL